MDGLFSRGMEALESGKIEEAIKLFSQLLEEAASAQSITWQVKALNNLGTANYKLKQYATALHQFEEALALWESEPQTDGEIHATLVNNAAMSAQVVGNLQKARKYYQKGLVMSRDPRRKAQFNMGMARTYQEMGFSDRSIKWARKAILLMQQFDIGPEVARYCLNLGRMYLDCNENELAWECFEVALEKFKAEGMPLQESFVYAEMARLYAQEDIARARELLDKALELKRQYGDEIALARNAEIKAIIEKTAANIPAAREELLQAIEIFARYNMYGELGRALREYWALQEEEESDRKTGKGV